ncbi:MAG TPA: hypothetical protein VMW83_03845 [Spirochaetia bacterium]|nr:hypothetical protein [Spirochaetia bacterium]
MELDSQNPFTLFLILVLLVLGSPNGGTHIDRHLDYMVNSLQAARNSIQTVRQGFQTFHATLIPPARVAQEPTKAWPVAAPPA